MILDYEVSKIVSGQLLLLDSIDLNLQFKLTAVFEDSFDYSWGNIFDSCIFLKVDGWRVCTV